MFVKQIKSSKNKTGLLRNLLNLFFFHITTYFCAIYMQFLFYRLKHNPGVLYKQSFKIAKKGALFIKNFIIAKWSCNACNMSKSFFLHLLNDFIGQLLM